MIADSFLKDNGKWAQFRWSANLENVDAWAEMPEPWRREADLIDDDPSHPSADDVMMKERGEEG